MRDTLLSPLWGFGWIFLFLLLLSLLSQRRWWLRAGLVFALVLWWGVSAPVVADRVLGHLESMARREAKRCTPPPPGSLFIVLAGGIRETDASADPVISLSAASLRRTLAAETLARGVPDSRLLFSGGHGGAVTEADLMRALALRLGFPAARIDVDDVSRTTYESARNLARRFGAIKHPPLYLVTSAYHMPRAYLAFRDSGLAVCALPVDFEASRSEDFDQWIPNDGAFAMVSRALHEYIGIVYYRLKFAGVLRR